MSSSGYRPQSVSEVLARGIVALAKYVESPRTDAQLLLASVLGRDRAWLLAHSDSFLSRPQAERFGELCEKRASGMPVAYILGTVGFYGREFVVNDKVLVPRPESEVLVEDMLGYLRGRLDPAYPKQLLTVLDIGTGSGAIACTLAAELAAVAVEGVDISLAALKVAEHNARRFNVFAKCKFRFGDLASGMGDRHFDAVVANLPYIPTGELPKRPDPLSFEPQEALDGGPDGLALYRRLLPMLPPLLKPGALVLLEAAPPTIAGLVDLARASFPRDEIVVGRDLAGLERYVRMLTEK
ncbi:MAG: peptide chain release factor N(5)-glutamine methyltransferase [Candidatus Baltobacteraceae bacterium]